MKHGLPEITVSTDKPELLFQKTFITSFWNVISSPAMVAAHLKPSGNPFRENSLKQNCPYKLDVRSTTNNNCSDLRDRKFLFPPKWTSNPDEAEYHTNLVEMDESFKTTTWDVLLKKEVEDYLTANQKDLYVILGTAFDYNYDGVADNLTAINSSRPSHFYLITLREDTEDGIDKWRGKSWVLPHIKSIPECVNPEIYISDHRTRIRDIELITGMRFITNTDYLEGILSRISLTA